MAYVPLDRDFDTLDPNRSYNADLVAAFRGFRSSSLKWPNLLGHKRTVVLAEASSGKTEEFRHQAETLRNQGSLGIYLPIERLGAAGLRASLGRDERALFDTWLRGGSPGWFFLDSIDEARIHRTDVERALHGFAVELGTGYDRARILLSCRGTVWEGEDDVALINGTLPVRAAPIDDLAELDPDDLLLRKPERIATHRSGSAVDDKKVTLVALAGLNPSQRSIFLAAQGVSDVARFNDAIYRRGLQPLVERPGDLRTLSRYWHAHSDLGDLTEMIEFGVKERLEESNENRKRSIAISPLKAREGAERLAAALTMGRSMDLVLPDIAPPGSRGTNPFEVLEDWNRSDVEGLLHRGLFAPSGTGTIRFFHRSAQEYLAASWFLRLELTDGELFRIFLAEPYGVPTLPPSLRATAGWIAAKHQGLRARILSREPQLLLAEGDPRKLSIAERSTLLANFAERELAGENSYRYLDHRALWMFADNALVPAIRRALETNRRPQFRFEMLRLIDQGKLGGCEDILVETAVDNSANDYHRSVALQALDELGAKRELKAIAEAVIAGPPPTATLGPAAALALFPAALSVEQLVDHISRTKPARRYQVEGYREELLALYERCRTDAERRKYLAGLARLAFEAPLGDWPRVSTRNATLVAMFAPTARRAIRDSVGKRITPELISFLRATGRVAEDSMDEGEPVRQLIRTWPKLNEALFWADAEASDREDGKFAEQFHDVSPLGPSLWGLSPEDRPWLLKSLRSNAPHQRLLAIDALIRLAFAGGDTVAELERLRKRVARDKAVEARVIEALTPRPSTQQDLERSRRWEALEQGRKLREEQTNEYWRDVRAKVQADPQSLRDEQRLRRWPGALPLLELTQWLRSRVSGGLSAAALQSPLLKQAFGPEVAEAFRDGMMRLWRVTKPERPKITSEGQRSIKHNIILSYAGLALEASTNARWASVLSESEARRAVGHAVLADQGTPQWLSDLLDAHPDIAGPAIATALKREWRASTNYTPFLSLAAHSLAPLSNLKKTILGLLAGPEPAQLERISTARDLVRRLELSEPERRKLTTMTLQRLRKARKGNDRERAAAQLRLLFSLTVDVAANELLRMIEDSLAAGELSDIAQLMKTSFNRHRDPAVNASLLSARQLLRLLEVAYFLRSKNAPAPAVDEQDEDEDDASNRDAFDDPLNELLSALLRSSDPEAYSAMLALANNPIAGASRHRLLELAREIAESWAERPAWSETDMRPFEDGKLAPIETGADLLELTCDLIDRIGWAFENADMSARSLVLLAEEETQVQQWLGSELLLMARERITVAQETVVAHAKRPDLTFAAARAPVEVAMEIKHGGKKWTYAKLSNSLRKQLAGQYLRPANRQHGVLVITNHRDRIWRDPATKAPMAFNEMIRRLKEEAVAINEAAAGQIRVEVRGIDATRAKKTKQNEKRR